MPRFFLPLFFVLAAMLQCPSYSQTVFNDRGFFQAATGALNVTGEFPALGAIPGGASGVQTVGDVTFSISSPSSNFIMEDVTPLFSGPELLVSGRENLNADFALPVYSAGFDFLEPQSDSDLVNGPFVDSEFTVSLRLGESLVDSFVYNAPNDVASFVGVWSENPFDRMEIRETVGGIGNEMFGQFYGGTTRPSDVLALHYGANDPLSEGWIRERQFSRVATFPVTNDVGKGIDAWAVDDNAIGDGTDGIYVTELNQRDVQRAMAQGFRLTADVRVVDHPSPLFAGPVTVRSIGGLFAFSLGAASDGTPTFRYAGTETKLNPDEFDSGYHRYEVTYDPTSNTANLAIDGISIRSDLEVAPDFSPGDEVVFGSLASSTRGQGNYNLIKFEILPYSPDLGENLLENPSFEVPENTVGLPRTFRDWGADVSEIVGSGDIEPIGSSMLQFLKTRITGNVDGSLGDVLQYVDLSGFREHIREGRLVALLTSKFNRVPGDENTDTEFLTALAAHEGGPETSPLQGVSIGFATNRILTDGDVATWQESAVELEIPSDADFLQVTLSAIENVLDNFGGTEFDGHFADDASLIVFIRGDFDFDAEFTATDIDQLSENIRTSEYDRMMDLNKDGGLTFTDRLLWINEFAGTSFGDANLDGQFNSTDLILILQAGEYADGIVGNSGWAEGDFGGDGEFDTDDLILALQTGRYEQGPTPAAVPEPAGLGLLVIGMLAFVFSGRDRRRR